MANIGCGPPPSNSDHQDSYMFSRGFRTKPSLATVTEATSKANTNSRNFGIPPPKKKTMFPYHPGWSPSNHPQVIPTGRLPRCIMTGKTDHLRLVAEAFSTLTLQEAFLVFFLTKGLRGKKNVQKFSSTPLMNNLKTT